MDLLAKRYANPFLILDQFISLNQLQEFTIEILNEIAKEKVHDARWQFYLHKVWSDITFEAYVQKCESKQQDNKAQLMTHEQIGNVIKDSKQMLEAFM